SIQPTIVHDLGMPASGGGAKRVFVTGTAYVSDSLATACRDAATAAGLGGTWTAWLSGPGDAINNITGSGSWRRLDGTVVFNNHSNLATQPLVPINIDENGRTLATGDSA